MPANLRQAVSMAAEQNRLAELGQNSTLPFFLQLYALFLNHQVPFLFIKHFACSDVNSDICMFESWCVVTIPSYMMVLLKCTCNSLLGAAHSWEHWLLLGCSRSIFATPGKVLFPIGWWFIRHVVPWWNTACMQRSNRCSLWKWLHLGWCSLRTISAEQNLFSSGNIIYFLFSWHGCHACINAQCCSAGCSAGQAEPWAVSCILQGWAWFHSWLLAGKALLATGQPHLTLSQSTSAQMWRYWNRCRYLTDLKPTLKCTGPPKQLVGK